MCVVLLHYGSVRLCMYLLVRTRTREWWHAERCPLWISWMLVMLQQVLGTRLASGLLWVPARALKLLKPVGDFQSDVFLICAGNRAILGLAPSAGS